MVGFGDFNLEAGHGGVGRGQPQLRLVRADDEGRDVHSVLKVKEVYFYSKLCFVKLI